MSRGIKLEICANSVASCVAAELGGADRVELCMGMSDGGITPSYGEMTMARECIKIDLNVLIRPRGGDFLYSPIEINTMLKDIAMAKQVGVDGVVIGALNARGDIDMGVMRELIAVADGLSLTFHRAFDVCRSPFDALEQIVELGFNRILTSGTMFSAEDGTAVIAELVERANDRVIIMPGGGINRDNILKIATETGANEFHTSARSAIYSSMQYRNNNVAMGGSKDTDEYTISQTDRYKVEEIKSIISNL